VLADSPGGSPELLLIASGSEVALIVAAANRLQDDGMRVRVVSMPSWELFDTLPQTDRDAVLPPSVRARMAVEAGVSQGWHRYVGDAGEVVSVERFGASAPGEVLLGEYGFAVGEICRRARQCVARHG
jgi:transketolase